MDQDRRGLGMCCNLTCPTKAQAVVRLAAVLTSEECMAIGHVAGGTPHTHHASTASGARECLNRYAWPGSVRQAPSKLVRRPP